MARRSDIRHLVRDLVPLQRASLESWARKLLDRLGARATPAAMIVKIAAQKGSSASVVCDGQSTADPAIAALFTDIWVHIDSHVAHHELRDIEHKEEWAARSQEERIRRSAVVRAVYQALADNDAERDLHSYCGNPATTDDDIIVPIIRIAGVQYRSFPALRRFDDEGRCYLNVRLGLVDAAMHQLLEHATEMLEDDSNDLSRLPDEIARESARAFARTFYLAAQTAHRFEDLFMNLNSISAVMYEGTGSAGQLIIARPDNPAIVYALRLKEPIPFKNARWSRKALQMAGGNFSLIADTEFVYGLGQLSPDYDFSQQDAFAVDFEGQLTWQLRHDTQVLLCSELGEPRLPREAITRAQFTENYSRIFPKASPVKVELMWELLQAAISLRHGSQIVVAEDAADEAARLAAQGTVVDPVTMTIDRFRVACRIDGGILLDPDGVCHAVGMIFDGEATTNCTASRGARYNSGVRYVQNKGKKRRVAIIVSDDRTLDVVPLLVPKALSDEIEQKIQILESPSEPLSIETLFQVRPWLFENEASLNAAQCFRANAALSSAELSLLGKRDTRDLKPHVGMNDEYFDW